MVLRGLSTSTRWSVPIAARLGRWAAERPRTIGKLRFLCSAVLNLHANYAAGTVEYAGADVQMVVQEQRLESTSAGIEADQALQALRIHLQSDQP